MLQKEIEPRTCKQLLKEFKEDTVKKTEILKFAGVGEKDVYNPSVPLEIKGQKIMAGRVEERDSELSRTLFFKPEGKKEEVWKVMEEGPEFELQDPFFAEIDDYLTLGGVRVICNDQGEITSWVTDFYRSKNLQKWEKFATGPSHMKDIRLIELESGDIGVFTRPQGEEMQKKYGCIAKIGFYKARGFNDITAEKIKNARLLNGLFVNDEWGGCNQLHLLKNGLIGVIGHKAYMDDEQKKHYYGIAFAFDPGTGKFTQNKIIITRDSFPEGPAKRSDLEDIIFTSGIIRNHDGTAVLYTGLSDCQVGRAVIADPFLEYED
ncbi:MAG: DUF1861 family protein [Halanaerobiales bacterium]